MSEQHLNPDVRHTVLQLMDGGVRLDPIKVSADDALAWAKKNNVDLTESGDREALINTARILRNLPPYKIISPPTPKVAAASTRDGHPSVAAAQQVHVDRPGDVDISVGREWAKANRLKWSADYGLDYADWVNEERRRLQLPAFRFKPRQGDNRPVSPGQQALSALPAAGPRTDPIVSTIQPEEGDAARWKSLPTTAGELFDMATSFVGTVSGTVTPEIAKLLLDLNVENRPLSAGAVARFVDILNTGRWINTGEPLIVASTGVLNDGQHRLHAIVEADIAAELDVRFGVPREAFTSTGTGLRRTNGHILALAGRQYATMQGALCRLLVHYDHGEMQKLFDGIDGDQAVRMTEDNPDIGRVAALLRSLKFKPIKNGAFGFVLIAVARELGFDKAEEFAKLVDSGQGAEDSPTRRLHVRLMEAALSKTVRLRPIDNCVMVALAWNAWISGKPVQVLRVHETHRTGSGFPRLVFE